MKFSARNFFITLASMGVVGLPCSVSLFEYQRDCLARNDPTKKRGSRGIITMVKVMRFNEGKACDAVLRWIEQREHAQRSDIRWLETEHDPAPVELVCNIGKRQYAIEHTGVEPFDGFMRLQNDALTHFQPLEDRIAQSLLATEYVELHMPLKATEGLRGRNLAAVQDALAAYVLAKVPTLPIAREGRYVLPILYETPAGVPFPVTLHRWPRSWRAKSFAIVQKIEEDLEAMRSARVARACEKKFPKLAVWQARGAKSIMILEDNDIQNTSEVHVAQTFLSAEKASPHTKPDEVYLVTTFSNIWFCHIIRIGKKTFFDFEDWVGRTWEVDPATLNDIIPSSRSRV